MKLFNSSKFFLYKIIFFTIIWIIIFVLSSEKCLIVGGDTIEYLEMSKNLDQGNYPKSDKWMPLYSYFVFIFSKLFCVSLLGGARIFQLILSSAIVIWYNYKIAISKTSYLKIIVMNLPFFCFSQFLYQSLAIMADFTFLVFTVLFLYYLYLYLSEGGKVNFLLSLIFCLISFMTKNNGLANFVLLFLVILLKNEPFFLMKLFGTFSLFLFYYYLWYGFKTQDDYLFGGIKLHETNRMEIFSEQIQGLFNSSLDYFFHVSPLDFIKNNIILLNLIVSCFFIFIIGYVFVKIYQKRYSFSLVLLVFCLLYTTLLFGRQLLVGYNEINIRTMFHVYFLLSVILVNKIITLKFKINFFILLLSFSFLIYGMYDMTRFVKRSYLFGIGKFSESRFDKNKNLLIPEFINIKNKLNILCTSIYSNENKTLGLISGINRYSELPSIWQFNGNNYVMDNKIFYNEKLELFEFSKNNKVVLVYFHFKKDKKRYDFQQIQLLREFVQKFKYNSVQNEFCTIIYP